MPDATCYSSAVIDRYERLRQSFRPERIGVPTQVLMIAESRPDSGKFFYRAETNFSNLFHRTREAFRLAYGRAVKDGVNFLQQYQRSGFFLVDLCSQPVNRGMSDEERLEAHRMGEQKLRRQLKKLPPNAHVVMVMKAIEHHVRRAGSNRPDLVFHPALPFPNWPKQRADYECGLAAFLRANVSFVPSGD